MVGTSTSEDIALCIIEVNWYSLWKIILNDKDGFGKRYRGTEVMTCVIKIRSSSLVESVQSWLLFQMGKVCSNVHQGQLKCTNHCKNYIKVLVPLCISAVISIWVLSCISTGNK
jgi:hypothetical protein